MRTLTRSILREIFSSALLGTLLFTFVLFLQRAGRSFELLARSASGLDTIGYLVLLIMPFPLTFALPVGALVGILIGLSRMSSDGEITGMRAAGVPGRSVLRPVMCVAVVFTLLTAACSMWLTPLSIRETDRVINELNSEQITAQVQPRVFQEQFPGATLYIADLIPGPVERWRNVFIADDRAPGSRSGGVQRETEGPAITLAEEAIAVPDLKNNRIQLHLKDASTYEAGRNPAEYYISTSPVSDQALQATRPGEVRTSRPFTEMDIGPLWRAAGGSRDAAVELHQRLALPFACILLALVGVPLGVSSRKSGKSAAFVVTVALAFFYYMGLISLISLARQGALPVWLAVWTPNMIFAAIGLVMMIRLEVPGDRDIVAIIKARFEGVWHRLRGLAPNGRTPSRSNGLRPRLPVLPQLVDTYILSSFLFYFGMLLASFVVMAQVFTFFELLGDILKHQVAMARVAEYLFFLTPKLLCDSTPVSVLVAVLVTFGVMSKSNEVTAFKATGVSLHRLAAPVLIASFILSLGLFAFDYYQVLPEANRRQDAIRNEIKGRPVQTYLRPDRRWILAGQGSRIYYFRYFDQRTGVMVGVSVYQFRQNPWRLVKHISAERAQWDASLQSWVFTNGWRRQLQGPVDDRFERFQVATFPELTEQPGYFLKEVIQDKQMNFRQLADYIAELRQSGFDTVSLRVQLQKKFAVPAFAFIMALISVPFAFMTGNRGAMAGVGVSLGIAVVYWATSQLFEQFGNINQLPAALAAWSPNAIFAVSGLFLMTRMRT